MRLFTDKIGWRFVVPRHQYFRSFRVAAVVPEIKGEINRQAFIALVWPLWAMAMLVILIPSAIGACMVWLSGAALQLLPDLDHLNGKAVREAWEKVPLDEIRERIGEPLPKINSKKPSQ